MKQLKKAFLFAVGAFAVAYEETTKVVKQQQEKLNKRFERKAA